MRYIIWWVIVLSFFADCGEGKLPGSTENEKRVMQSDILQEMDLGTHAVRK